MVCAFGSVCTGILILMAAFGSQNLMLGWPQSLHYSVFLKYLLLHFNHECSCVSPGAQGAQKGTLDSLELELQWPVSLAVWLLGTELRTSAL